MCRFFPLNTHTHTHTHTHTPQEETKRPCFASSVLLLAILLNTIWILAGLHLLVPLIEEDSFSPCQVSLYHYFRPPQAQLQCQPPYESSPDSWALPWSAPTHMCLAHSMHCLVPTSGLLASHFPALPNGALVVFFHWDADFLSKTNWYFLHYWGLAWGLVSFMYEHAHSFNKSLLSIYSVLVTVLGGCSEQGQKFLF
jgi:hypothetical protein